LQVLKNQSLQAIESNKMVKLTDMGNVKEILCIDKLNLKGFPIKKINKNEYMLLSTGEVFEYKNHSENRSQDIESLRRTFKNIREVINTNFIGEKNELAFTITYAENMTNTKVLYADFVRFMKKIYYNYQDVDYINVVEPQGRGAWHCHVLLRFNDYDKIYIPNKQIADMWGHGFVKVKAIKQNVDNLGAYLSAYLGDVELNSDNLQELTHEGVIRPGQSFDVKEVEIEGVKKKFIKGGRLHFYPVNMKICRCSRGIRKPTKEYMTYEDAKKRIGVATPTYETRTLILDDNGEQLNAISYEQYNKKRK
jgi:hypothetical protein